MGPPDHLGFSRQEDPQDVADSCARAMIYCSKRMISKISTGKVARGKVRRSLGKTSNSCLLMESLLIPPANNYLNTCELLVTRETHEGLHF